jgi:hypothetical protein
MAENTPNSITMYPVWGASQITSPQGMAAGAFGFAERFRFVAEALLGTGGFAPDPFGHLSPYQLPQNITLPVWPTYLVRYPRESVEKFNRRNQLAVYRNFLHSACARFTGYLFSQRPNRMDVPALLQPILDNADGCGNRLDVFWHEFALHAKARGTLLLLVDMPHEIPGNRAEQIAARALPYFSVLYPESIADYKLDDYGKFEHVALWAEQEDKRQVWRVWDKQGWRVQQPSINGTVLDQGEHVLGECPVLIFTERGGFPCHGEFSQIADLSKAWFNRVSERDEILRAQTFSVLTYQTTDRDNQLSAAALSEAIGAHSMLTHTGIAPSFIAPEASPAEIYSKVIDGLETAIRDIAYSVELTAQAEAAAALNLRFRNLSSALSLFAQRMQDLESRAWWLACRWLEIKTTPQVQWPASYDIADVRGELEILQLLQASNFPTEAITEQQKRIAQIQFQGMADVDLEPIIAAIGEAGLEAPPSPPPGKD